MKSCARNHHRLVLMAFHFVLLPIFGVSCATRVDTSNPKTVATAFICAAANKNVKEATQYVIPEERDDFQKDLENPPPLPKDPEIRVTVKEDRAGVDILNAIGVGLNMKLRDGRWWIVK